MRGAAGDDHDVPALGRRASAVAEDVAALHLVHVEDRRAHAERAPVAEPEPGADAGPEVEVAVGRCAGWPSRRRSGARRRPAARRARLATTSVISALRPRRGASRATSAGAARTPRRRGRPAARRRPPRPVARGGEPVPQHRGEQLQHDPGAGAGGGSRGRQRREVLQAAQGVDHPRVVGDARPRRAATGSAPAPSRANRDQRLARPRRRCRPRRCRRRARRPRPSAGPGRSRSRCPW